MTSGTVHIVGVGPGDPELLTLKAARVIGQSGVVAYFCRHDRMGHARRIADAHISEGTEELRFAYPFTIERAVSDPSYHDGMGTFYDECADKIAAVTAAGRDVALLCEGDPFLYGSAMYLFDRLRETVECRIVPGITGMGGCWSEAAVPMTHGDDVLCVLPATMPEDELASWLIKTDAAVVMKLGRNLPKLRSALERAGRSAEAVYVERGTQQDSRVTRLEDMDGPAPYFSLALLPGRRGVR
ncbi:precorrin-2 C(20)-methyltransferase [Gluconobacter wancherniae]|uniref:Precorrin-2 C(20)-methyltransferase n=1 Tax=Gluconobacter wancherniae NBRC 103581 TaxID=656744 RepID=A0A511AZE9_9PROT|nr:precorrin-2 C(20)-methyltransferase [Gluconobacter wancherniae]MBF0853154.1 precorrin-2 C(20)-methyltransferase [Gluconobacter wancherniae]GBD56128.1 precorrin-2 C(20)-methyltransferase [Gluconobacter wancherniae NBRC 103581]GBR63250.1 precorrin-2 C20-methyltransferase [Gluconobacter wancherniae NBRC 103581]GEK92972.1 precorrin-2 C(20)-methyltransferase [Gluconobacter wancherniae NBRC 103581]